MIGITRSIANRVFKITLEGAGGNPVPDGDGGYILTPAALDPPFAYGAVEPALPTDLERFTAGTVSATASLLISIPFHPGVNTETVLSWTDLAGRARKASVVGLINVEERCNELVLACAEAVA